MSSFNILIFIYRTFFSIAMSVPDAFSTIENLVDQEEFNTVVEEMTRSISSVKETVKRLLSKLAGTLLLCAFIFNEKCNKGMI